VTDKAYNKFHLVFYLYHGSKIIKQSKEAYGVNYRKGKKGKALGEASRDGACFYAIRMVESFHAQSKDDFCWGFSPLPESRARS